MDPERVPGRLSEALGFHEQSALPAHEHLARHLADKDLLLVVDNCEHVVDSVASLLGSLLHALPDSR